MVYMILVAFDLGLIGIGGGLKEIYLNIQK